MSQTAISVEPSERRLGSSARAGLPIRACEAALVAALVAYGLYLWLHGPGGDRSVFFDRGVYCALLAGSALLVLARAILVERERLAWTCLGLNLLAWTIGELYWALALADNPNPPYPSWEDAFDLLSYPLAYVGVALLVRDRVKRFRSSIWLDGAIAGLTVAAFWTAFVLPSAVTLQSGNGLGDAVTLAYPVLDMVQLAFLCGVLLLVGWRWDRSWALLAAGFLVIPAADTAFTIQESTGGYMSGTMIDFIWTLGAVLIALAAWQPPQRDTIPAASGWRSVAGPASFTLLAAGLLAFGYLQDINTVAVVLAAAAIAAVAARMSITYLDNQRLLEQAQTDSLTGLGNRGRLMIDLRDELAHGSESEPRILVMLDLDGFKLYNDSFGHPAGDALLRRLAIRLGEAVGEHGEAYRIGGDEFCVLLECEPSRRSELVARLGAALSERGEAFDVACSYGAVEMPIEASKPSTALQTADRRMYENKNRARSSARNQAKAVLMKIVREREPELNAHVTKVAELAGATARRLGIEGEELDVISRAAELHDIGKLAVPDAVLSKPSRLDSEEWRFINDHTVVGERILDSAPALAPVARLVRSSHERWDGAGYPDGLAGREIPLGSRIIFACDAFNAMTTSRPYAAAIPEAVAIQELRRCAGSQFDPAVVEALCAAITALPSAVRPGSPSASP